MQHYQQPQHNHQSQPRLPPILPPPGSVPPESGSGSGFVSGIEAAAASALTLANNIAFRPMTTQPAKCSKLKIRIFFDSTLFQAGGTLFGRMEVTATSSRSLKLGEIAVELAAYEEITSKEFTATQSFLSSRLCFQGTGIPPSNAVHGPCDDDGFWMAKKGKTTFPFAFQLPLDCPSSLVFGQTASLRYVVTGLVQVFYHGKDETILKSKEAFVVEAWDGYNPDYRLPVQASNSTKLFWGGSGTLELEAMLAERLHSAGGNLPVEVRVKNNTSRKVQGIRIGVARRLEMVSDKAQAELNPGLKIETVSVSEVIGTQEFKSSSYLFDTGEERTMTINMTVPGNARTIRGTALFEVTCFVVVSMLLGAFSGELSVEIPVKICHPASLTPAPKPKLDQNHLPHQYNIVDDDLDLNNDMPTKSNRRIGSNVSLAISTGYDPDGRDQQDDSGGAGRQGEWNGDDRGLSPANSITSIKSLLASPKQKLSKLADKIQRSTSPTSSGHIQHEHRKDSDNFSGAPSRRMVKSPPLGPAAPVAYVPAVERVRYTPFQPPPTTKAKEFLKAAAQYQQEMSGVLAGLGGDDNVEFDLDDKAMATAIHQWISKKESEGRYQSQAPLRAPTATRPTPPIQIPAASPNRRRHPVEPINTQIGSFTSQISPGSASPQSYYSPASPEPSSPTATAFSNQTTSRFIHHAHRQPAAPQTGAFGSVVEDCMTDPPLFARPLPLPSPPPTGSPKRPGLPNPPVHPRPISPSPASIPIQTAESLALAREAYERVKRAGSPVPDLLQNATTPGSSAPRSGFVHPHHHPSSFDINHDHPNIKVPVPVNSAATQSNIASSPSGLSRLLSDPAPAAGPQLTHHVKHGYDGHLIDNSLPPTCSSPELRHIPLNRPLPVPGPKPQHLNQGQAQAQVQAPAQNPGRNPIESNPNIFTREAEARPRPEPAPKPPIATAPAALTTASTTGAATTTSSGHLRGPQPVMEEGATRSGHLYTPRPTPTLTARPPAPLTTVRVSQHAAPTNKPPTVNGAPAPATAPAPTRATAGHARKPVAPVGVSGKLQDQGSGFIYPKATRKPVAGTKPPTIAAKPKNLASLTQQHAHTTDPPGPDHTTSRPILDVAAHREFDQRLRRPPQGSSAVYKSKGENLAPTASMRAPQMITMPSSSSSSSPSLPLVDVERRSVSPRGDRRTTHVTRGFQTPRDAMLEEEPGEVDKDRSAATPQQRGPTEGSIGAASEDPRHRQHHQQQRHQSHTHGSPQERDQRHQQYGHAQAQCSPQDNNVGGPSANQALDDSEVVQETPGEIRAQAVAAANSVRAKGANSGGYVVNTGKLRQAIRNTDSTHAGNGSSGHLIQALTDGAMNVASAAVSGLGWGGQQSSPSPPSKPAPIAAPRPSAQQHRGCSDQSPQRSSTPLAALGHPTRPQQQLSPPNSRHLDRTAAFGRSHHHHQNPVVEQAHDLTMKDIHFQTLAPGEYVIEQQPRAAMFDPPLPETAPLRSTSPTAAHETVSAVAPMSMTAAPTTATTTIPVTSSQHQVRVTQGTVATVTTESPANQQQKSPAQSRSQPASKVMDIPIRNDPLPPTSVTVAVEAHPDPTTPTASVIAPPRLDKTLPKIQEQPASRSRILDRPQRQQSPTVTETPSRPSAAPGSVTAAIFNSNNIHIPPLAKAAPPLTPAQQQRARYYYGRAAESSATSGATALAAIGPSSASSAYSSSSPAAGGAKAINPKLQEYIQKYNLAANTRS
ncbi:hypothetical protein BG015_008751 [Linnemannia schmuckeri]|uniref:Arrestin C-terminal-like domain-containing protein n=1 Tax=Linnemannia schmuckeri TaxID=64567 RepID=A0A9P5VAG0_9FUNG|nr:hypothetical protein BG015_008751 [Linnemannia schmuckeri]